ASRFCRRSRRRSTTMVCYECMINEQNRPSVMVTFFFQAEDGIRSLTVTGVQTCALPISAGWIRTVGQVTAVLTGSEVASDSAPRSEERRVGKECRLRRASDYEKKKSTRTNTGLRTDELSQYVNVRGERASWLIVVKDRRI